MMFCRGRRSESTTREEERTDKVPRLPEEGARKVQRLGNQKPFTRQMHLLQRWQAEIRGKKLRLTSYEQELRA